LLVSDLGFECPGHGHAELGHDNLKDG